jgi:hypothetical protein
MANPVYRINKGINKPIEFKGLKAQYIWYLGGGIITLMIGFAIMYITGVNSYLCVAVILAAGSALFFYVYRLSNRYGEHGLKKKIAKKYIPKVVKSYNRKMFLDL